MRLIVFADVVKNDSVCDTRRDLCSNLNENIIIRYYKN